IINEDDDLRENDLREDDLREEDLREDDLRDNDLREDNNGLNYSINNVDNVDSLNELITKKTSHFTPLKSTKGDLAIVLFLPFSRPVEENVTKNALYTATQFYVK
ncbi:302_t:CDS:2, partial [Cetraspora pellucida]